MGAFAMPALLAGSTAIQAGASIAGGMAQGAAYESERRQYEVQARDQRIAADQEETIRRRQLEASLGVIRAQRGARGLDAGSPTGQAILRAGREAAASDIQTAKFNRLAPAETSRMSGIMRGRLARSARFGGFIDAAGRLAEGAGTIYEKWPRTKTAPGQL